MDRTLQIRTNTWAYNNAQGYLALEWVKANEWTNDNVSIGQWIGKYARSYENSWYGLRTNRTSKDVAKLAKNWTNGKLNEAIHMRFAARHADMNGLHFEQAPDAIDVFLGVDAILVGHQKMAYIQFTERDKRPYGVTSIDGLEHDVVVLKGEDIEDFIKDFAANAAA